MKSKAHCRWIPSVGRSGGVLNTYLKTVDSDWFKNRLTGMVVCGIAAFALLFARLIYLQVIQGEELRRLSENNCIRLQSISPSRGLIYDRKGALLVDNRPAFDLSIVVKDAKPLSETVGKLANYIQVPADELMDKIRKGRGAPSYKPIVLERDISREILAAVEVHRYDLPGVVVDVKPRRHYIHGQTAAHLLGYLAEINEAELESGKFPGYKGGESVGKCGVERSFESFLRGKAGGRQVEVDATGRVVRELEKVEARPGHNLYLTIDLALQKKAEILLEGNAGTVVAMDPFSGHILALASSPSFDLNLFVKGIAHDQWQLLRDNPRRPMENKATQAQYPPASTYKIVTAMAAIEEGIIDENSTYFCPGRYKLGDRVFRCWRRGGHGKINVVDAIAQSCDVFFYQAGLKLGVDRLAHYAKACGLGNRTGIDLGHEADGLIPTAAWKKRRTGVRWQRGETLSIAIGQGYNLVTPLQMARFMAAIANGGTLKKPLVIDKIVSAEGKTVYVGKAQNQGQLPISAKTLNLIRKGMWEVVNGRRGTARIARLEDVEIGGKTGTAQVFTRRNNDANKEEDLADHLKSHAWFVSYAPMDAPRIAVAVMVEHGEHGSSAASPIARDLIREHLTPKSQVVSVEKAVPAG